MSVISGRRILITGANRGLGLEMTKQLLKCYNPQKIFAACRTPEQAAELKKLATQDPRVHIMKIDVCDDANFHRATQEVHTATNGEGIHVLINNAGIFISENQSLEKVSKDMMLDMYRVNTLGAIFLTQAFLPLLITSNSNENRKGVIVNFSSRLGSISDNSSGGYYASRCCRSAMNAATKSMSIDLNDKNIIAVGMNPGWVKTQQGGSSAKLEVDESVRSILNVLDKLEEHQSGSLLQYDGQIVEW